MYQVPWSYLVSGVDWMEEALQGSLPAFLGASPIAIVLSLTFGKLADTLSYIVFTMPYLPSEGERFIEGYRDEQHLDKIYILVFHYFPNLWYKLGVPNSVRENMFDKDPELLEYYFKHYARLELQYLPNYILKEFAFATCIGITSVNLGTGVTLDNGPFSSLTSLTTITLPTGTIITGAGALQDCTSLQTINFTDAPTTITSSFALQCTSFTGGTNLFNAASATFAPSITTFKNSCFNGAQLPTIVNFTVVAVFETRCFLNTAITTVNAKTGSTIASDAFPAGATINLT